jgi:hypothetical protein
VFFLLLPMSKEVYDFPSFSHQAGSFLKPGPGQAAIPPGAEVEGYFHLQVTKNTTRILEPLRTF